MTLKDFKAIIVGGGPVGLTAAHAFYRAGIDFVLLERKPEVVIDAGSNLVLMPDGLQAMAQLGLVDALNNVSTALTQMNRVDHQGNNIGDIIFFEQVIRIIGVASRVISRHGLTATLYNTLPADMQAKILPAKQLSRLESNADGVVATCADSTSYAGSIIVGADGAHSATRALMRPLLKNHNPTDAPFLTTYRCLWVRFPTPAGLPLGSTCETHGYKLATQLFTGEDSSVIAVYEQLDNPRNERIRHTMADQLALVSRWADLPVVLDGSMTLQDVFNSRMEAGLVSLEEGVVKEWSADGRAKLAGDAAHKFTPSTGSGCNNGMLDVACLVSELDTAPRSANTQSNDTGKPPRKDTVASAFRAYEEKRRAVVEAECQRSSERTALATWQTEKLNHIDVHVAPDAALQEELVRRLADGLAKAPRFEFFDQQQHSNGSAHPMGTALPSPVAVH